MLFLLNFFLVQLFIWTFVMQASHHLIIFSYRNSDCFSRLVRIFVPKTQCFTTHFIEFFSQTRGKNFTFGPIDCSFDKFTDIFQPIVRINSKTIVFSANSSSGCVKSTFHKPVEKYLSKFWQFFTSSLKKLFKETFNRSFRQNVPLELTTAVLKFSPSLPSQSPEKLGSNSEEKLRLKISMNSNA